jgi:hypothetical protein
VRGHWPFVVVLSAGLALRVLTEVAYRPALLYIDSAKYLVSSGGTAPEGYQVLLRLLDPIGGLALVAAVQHAFGLATACFVLPVLGYMTAAYFVTGHFGLASNGPTPEYGRAAAAADCGILEIPADERALCPSPGETLALGGIDGLLHNPKSPGHTVPLPPGTTRQRLLEGFSLAVFRQQPLRVAASVARDSIRLFALTRDGDPEITSIARWQFQVFYPTYPHRYTMAVFTRLARGHGSDGPGGDRAGRHRAARLPARRRLHARSDVRGRPGRRAARIVHRPGQAPSCRRPRAGRRLPAGDASRRRAPAQFRRVRVLLALPVARRGHAAGGRGARAHRRRRPGQPGQGTRKRSHCCPDLHRRYRSTNSSRICGVRSSGASRPDRLMVSRICARYSVQCGQPARCASKRRLATRLSVPSR